MVVQTQNSGPAGGKKYLRPPDLRQLKNLLFAARAIVEGAYTGRHKSPFKGSAQEFTDYREYHPGDEIRSIDWKAYARTDRYIIKLFEKETDMTCYLLVDSSASMDYGGADYDRFFPGRHLSKFEYACYLAAALAYLAVRQGDKVGLTLFDERVKHHLPPGGTFSHLYHILNLLENNQVGAKTSIAQVLQQAFGLIKRRGLLVLISDLLDEPEEIFRALNRYRHHHIDILLLHVLHQYELQLPPMPNARFIDAESGAELTSVPAEINQSYNQEIRHYLRTLAAMSAARRIDYELITTETPYQVVLQNCLQRRTWPWD